MANIYYKEKVREMLKNRKALVYGDRVELQVEKDKIVVCRYNKAFSGFVEVMRVDGRLPEEFINAQDFNIFDD